MTWIAIPFACLTFVTTLIGGRIALKLAHNLPTVIAFTGGIVVAVALFDVLPEAIDAIGHAETTAALVGVGFLAFFPVERLLVLHHRDDPEQARAHHQVGALGATGLAVHSFIDGLGIGLAFGLDTATGVLVFVAVAAHDFAHGMNMVSFILMQSGNRGQARRWLIADAVAPLLGALVGASVVDLRGGAGPHPGALRRVLHLPGSDGPDPGGAPRARVLVAGRADGGGVRADLRGGANRRRLSGRGGSRLRQRPSSRPQPEPHDADGDHHDADELGLGQAEELGRVPADELDEQPLRAGEDQRPGREALGHVLVR